MPRALILVAVASLGLSACTPTVSQNTETTTVTLGMPITGPSPVGRFFVKAGDDDLNADLFELESFPADFTRLTTEGRVSSLDGCDDMVVVSAAQADVGYSDHIQVLRGTELRPVKGLGLEVGSNPDVAPDCRVLFIRLADAEPTAVREILLFDPETDSATMVAEGETVFGASWGPNGEILLLHREPTGARLVVMQPDGSRSEIDPQQPDVGNIMWGPSGWIAMDVAEVDEAPTGILFINPTSGDRSLLDGWLPLAWSPDGQQLLVTDADRGTNLAVVELPDLTRTRGVGYSDVGTIWDAVWLPPAATTPAGAG